MANKWIISSDSIKMSRSIEFHSELASKGVEPSSGGYFDMNEDQMYVMFYGKSHDYGQATLNEFRNAVHESRFSVALEGFKVYFSEEESLAKAFENETYICKIVDCYAEYE